jgi:hypothetical protein
MSTLNQNNINAGYLNNIGNTIDSLSNITINNSIKISRGVKQTNNAIDNANSAIYLKDISSNGTGLFYPLRVDSTVYTTPTLYFNNNTVIDGSNLLSELENTLIYHPLETSNIIVKGGYINFWNGSNVNSNIGSTGVGLRYSSNNTVQFKNYNTNWIDLIDITTHDLFSELIDVDVITNPLQNNQYITYNASSMKYVNSNLAIINDLEPTLGGNLAMETYSLIFGSNTSNLIVDNGITRNTLIQFNNLTTSNGIANYLQINNADTGSDPTIYSNGTDTNIGLTINTKGTGDISLNASTGNIYTNADSLVIGGFVKNSVYRSSTKSGGYNPSTPWTIPLTNDIFLFDFDMAAISGTYYANVSAGIDGQKLNFIFNNKSSNGITVLADFGTNGLLIGTGYSNGLVFQTTGQSTSLVYLADGIDAWQVMNTGASVL